MSHLPGIAAKTVQTSRLRSNVIYRKDPPAGTVPLVFVHGNVSSSLFWEPLMLALPPEVNAVAVDLRGYGDSEAAPVDGLRGVRDFSDDLAEVLTELDLEPAHLVGWSMGAGVLMQYALDHPVRTMTLISPISPYGFGGTARDGSLLNADAAGTGGGGVNPEFIERLRAGDRSSDSPTSPRSVYATAYVKPGFVSAHEDLWVDSMLTTAMGVDNYPGDSTTSETWPGFAPGNRGVLNTMAPTHFDVTGIVDLPTKPPVLWVRGLDDVIVSDTSYFDVNFLGQLGAIPGWPGADVAPPQPMIGQTRAVLDAYSANGGSYREMALGDCGHSPHLEHPDAVRAAIVEHVSR